MNQRILPILTQDDIPSSLLWLVRVLETHQPLVFLPSEGSEPLAEICQILGFIPSRLSRASAFNSSDVIPQLLRMYPQLTMEEISSRFNLNHKAMLSAMSALLRYASLVQSNIHNIVERMPCGIMYIDAAATQWLQLTRTERHPCAYQGIGQPKEGLSLFSVVNQTVSVFGRSLLRQWFALPSCDLDELQQRQQVVRYFSAVICRETLQQIRCALKKIHPTDPAFTLMRRGKATLRHYRLLLQTMHGLIALHALLFPIAHEVDFLRNLINSFNVESIQNMASTLENSVFCILQSAQTSRDSNHRRNSMTDEQRGDNFLYHVACMVNRDPFKIHCYAVTLQWGVDGVLDELREHYAYLPSILEQKAKESEMELLRDMSPIDAHIRRVLRTLRCIQIESLGYVLCVDEQAFLSSLSQFLGAGKTGVANVQGSCDPTLHSPMASSANIDRHCLASTNSDEEIVGYFCRMYGWEHVKTSEGLLYFKTSKMRELDTYVGDLLQRMVMRENDVRRELEEELLRCSLDLLTPARPLAELDCLLSFAYCATEYQWVCPKLVRKRGLVHIVDGWHPLLQHVLRGNELVPFTFSSSDASEQVCVVTGGSGSGKSALISAIAQIVILAQLGSFVPSRQATLGLFGYIFTCNATDVVLGQLSSFQSECFKMNRILRHCAYERVAAEAAVSEAIREPIKECGEKDGRRETGNMELGAESQPCDTTTTLGVSSAPGHHLMGTLILIDDIGRGTTPHDAMALLGAVLRYLAGLKVSHQDAEHAENEGGCISEIHVGYPRDKSEVVCSTVLCATRFYELMYVGQQYIINKGMHTKMSVCNSADINEDELLCSELLRFPFERITFYDLPCLAMYPDEKKVQHFRMEHEADEKAAVCVESASCSNQHEGKEADKGELPIDVVPTYQPYKVIVKSDQHQRCYNPYKGNRLYGGVAMAQRHNLLPSLLAYWREGLKVMSSSLR
ncbi:unnamed protein product [Phytomonas sp. EM1]|nr:unnamed protein product [Phytomonas sp. EM1]|eukprot:CCW59681.1 unnamed protein product [Phytomonas sp. isolate EM1]